jgi:hypothetical protein
MLQVAWHLETVMAADNQPLFVDATSIYAFSADEDLEWNFGELIDTYLDSPVDEHVDLLYEDSDYSTPGDLLRANLVTKGQYLLVIASHFHAQLCNGGLAQFITNKPEWIADVQAALSELGMIEFRDEFEKTIMELRSYFGEGSGEPELHRLSIEYDLLIERLSDTLIDEHYSMRWSETDKNLHWDPSQWSQQLLQKIIDYALAHPSEFRKMQ